MRIDRGLGTVTECGRTDLWDCPYLVRWDDPKMGVEALAEHELELPSEDPDGEFDRALGEGRR